MTVIDGKLAEAGGETQEPGPSGPMRIKSSGRNVLSASDWTAPLAPRLMARLPEQARKQHQQLVRRHAAARVDAANLTARLDAAKVEDERAFQAALERGAKPPAVKADGLQVEVERAREQEQQVGRMVVESGKRLASHVTDEDVTGVLEAGKEEIAGTIDNLPAQIRELRAQLLALGQVAHELAWVSRLGRTRVAAPYRARGAVAPGQRLSAATELLGRAQAEIDEEIAERDRRAAGPVRHPAPRGFAPPEGSFATGPVALG